MPISHGSKSKYQHELIGGNFRLDALQAAVLVAKLPYLDGWTAKRQRNAERYNRLFQEAGVKIGLPECATGRRHIFNQYILRVPQRDKLKAALAEKGIATEVYYPVPLHLQECFAYLGFKAGDFPESEAAAKQTLALPIYPELADAQAEYVVACVAEFFGTEPRQGSKRQLSSAPSGC